MRAIPELLTAAIAHYRAHRLQEADAICQQILAAAPNHADALHLAGVVARDLGRIEVAVECFSQAIAANGARPDYHVDLGTAYITLRRFDDAVACFKTSNEMRPHDPQAWHNLGVALSEQGRHSEAIACYQQVLQLSANAASTHFNLGNAWRALGNLEQSVASYERGLQLAPQDSQGWCLLGDARRVQGLADAAIECYERAIQLKPDLVDAFLVMAKVLKDQGRIEAAIAACRRAVAIAPSHAVAHNNLGAALKDRGMLREAIASYRRAVGLQPDFLQAHVNLGNALQVMGKPSEAIDCCRTALSLAADSVEARIVLGNALRDRGALDDAVACFKRVLERDPDNPSAHNNLGQVFKDQGNLDEALESFRRAVNLKPDRAAYYSNLVYTLYFHPAFNPYEIYREHEQWNRRHAEPLASQCIPHSNDRSPERRLRVGYVSPDFRSHPVGRFLLPLLEAHDRENFEIYGYSSVRNPDDLTGRCRANADLWRNILGLSDEAAARLIRDDQIDILIDLTMHMADNRLLVFARRPAPVQATYLAYCGTTGLVAIDYRLTDPFLDPPLQNDAGGGPIYSEESICLAETYWCYPPPAEIEMPGAPPALASGTATFGCLNNFCKVTGATLDGWGRLMQRVPGSRLVIHARPGSHRDRVRDVFARQNIAPDRLTFADKMPLREYLRLYNKIDVALDPFPYGGGTTTCDALWMGVPVVSLAGETAVSRGGLSILSNLGLPELVATDIEQYIEIASGLAGDLSRLADLRRTLRDRMLRSPLMDAPRFAQNIETAYRRMWHRWCRG